MKHLWKVFINISLTLKKPKTTVNFQQLQIEAGIYLKKKICLIIFLEILLF